MNVTASFWTAVPAGLIMMASFWVTGGAANAGWTGYYAPLSVKWHAAPYPTIRDCGGREGADGIRRIARSGSSGDIYENGDA